MRNRVLIVIDIQKEYETEGRPYFINGVLPSLKNAKSVLEHARAQSWPIYHIQHLQNGDIFGKESPYSNFISGFEPLQTEKTFIKRDYSCYSSLDFLEQMKVHISDEIVVIGYGSTKCCLATIVDGYHREQKFIFVQDASNAKRSEKFDELSLHMHATDILSSYCSVTTAKDILNKN